MTNMDRFYEEIKTGKSHFRRSALRQTWVGIHPQDEPVVVEPHLRFVQSTEERDEDCFYCYPSKDELVKVISSVPNRDPNIDSDWLMVEVPHKGRWMGVENQRHGFPGPTSLDDFLTAHGIENSIIEHPYHNESVLTYSPQHLGELLKFIRDRITYYQETDPTYHYYLVTRDLGTAVGEKSRHPHSHVYATPFIPPSVELEIKCAERFFEYRRKCAYCQLIDEELRIKSVLGEDHSRIVYENDNFLVVVPFAPKTAYETWILPKAVETKGGSLDTKLSIVDSDGVHKPLIKLSDESMQSLADVYSKVVRALYDVTGGAPMRMYLRTMPTEAANTHFLQAQKQLERQKRGVSTEEPILVQMYYHPHIQIQPKLYEHGGFIISSGTPVTPILPERAAGLLREAINKVV